MRAEKPLQTPEVGEVPAAGHPDGFPVIGSILVLLDPWLGADAALTSYVVGFIAGDDVRRNVRVEGLVNDLEVMNNLSSETFHFGSCVVLAAVGHVDFGVITQAHVVDAVDEDFEGRHLLAELIQRVQLSDSSLSIPPGKEEIAQEVLEIW